MVWGGVNIDGCRISYNGETPNIGGRGNHTRGDGYGYKALGEELTPNQLGRFPANVIHDGSEEVENLFLLDNGENPARFFYTAKASQSERNYGLNNFIEKRHSDRNKDDGAGGDNPRNRSNKPKKNFHPTVKPIDLMRYLVRLVTPKGGVCLDPYLGSGTTAVACKAERINYIGIELDPDYVEIAEARINAEMVHYDIFDFLEE